MFALLATIWDCITRFILPLDVNQPDEYGKTALHSAVIGNYLECVNLLLSNGANVQTSDETGETPIHSATRNGNEAIVTVFTFAFPKTNALSYTTSSSRSILTFCEFRTKHFEAKGCAKLTQFQLFEKKFQLRKDH